MQIVKQKYKCCRRRRGTEKEKRKRMRLRLGMGSTLRFYKLNLLALLVQKYNTDAEGGLDRQSTCFTSTQVQILTQKAV